MHYFSDDYRPIDQNFTNFTASTANIDQSLVQEAPSLYNGNISHMVTTIMDASNAITPQLTAYRYDQLNRITQMKTVLGNNLSDIISGNNWAANIGDNYAETYRYDANGNIAKLTRRDASGSMFDDLLYNYGNNNVSSNNNITQWTLTDNKLTAVEQQAGTVANQFKTTKYDYDAIGNLIRDDAEGINIEWNVYGKITKIKKDNGELIEFIYDAMGNRICKKLTQSGIDDTYHFYTRDAQGNIMATYKTTNSQTTLTEFDIYGSSRIGIKAMEKVMQEQAPNPTYSRILGDKRYEISNHLGNVISIFSDRKIAKDNDGDNIIDNYQTYLVSSQDYTPFGAELIGRGFNSNKYRFGFNGQEKDDEIYNNESTTTATFWEYDGRIGRRWNVDPEFKIDPAISTYSAFFNNPILHIDDEGNWPARIHEQIIRTAFAKEIKLGKITEQQVKWMIQGSKKADNAFIGNQLSSKSHLHSMQRKGESSAIAKGRRDRFVNAKINEAVDDLVKNNDNESYWKNLGMAMHPKMDETSPTHTTREKDGSYTPIENDLSNTGVGLSSGINLVKSSIKLNNHLKGEQTITNTQMDDAVKMVRSVYNTAEGKVDATSSTKKIELEPVKTGNVPAIQDKTKVVN